MRCYYGSLTVPLFCVRGFSQFNTSDNACAQTLRVAQGGFLPLGGWILIDSVDS